MKLVPAPDKAGSSIGDRWFQHLPQTGLQLVVALVPASMQLVVAPGLAGFSTRCRPLQLGSKLPIDAREVRRSSATGGPAPPDARRSTALGVPQLARLQVEGGERWGAPMAKEAEGEGEVGNVNGEGRWKKEREAGAAAWAGQEEKG